MSPSALRHMAEHKRKLMDDNELLLWRDGQEHQIGPLLLRYMGPESGGPEGVCTVRTERAAFTLDWMDAQAIAWCIAPSADLWGAYDSDREDQPDSGERRGWLRLKITAEEDRLDGLTGWAGRAFQANRVVMDAGTGEVVRRRTGERSTDYRRACLLKVGGPARADTRTSFIHASTALAKHFHPTLPPSWAERVRGLWWAADETQRVATQLAEGD